MDEEIKKYKIYFTKHLQNEKDYTVKLNKYFNSVLSYINDEYKNIANLMHSSLMFYIFLIDRNEIIKYSLADIKKIFYLENIVQNSLCMDEYDTSEEEDLYTEHSLTCYDTISINTNINLLNYHPLIVNNLEKKEKLLKIISNKLILAIKIDLLSNNQNKKFVDFYGMIENSLKTRPLPKQKFEFEKKTQRGGFKKKMKFFKKKDIWKKNEK